MVAVEATVVEEVDTVVVEEGMEAGVVDMEAGVVVSVVVSNNNHKKSYIARANAPGSGGYGQGGYGGGGFGGMFRR